MSCQTEQPVFKAGRVAQYQHAQLLRVTRDEEHVADTNSRMGEVEIAQVGQQHLGICKVDAASPAEAQRAQRGGRQ